MSSVTTSGATRSTFSFARIWDQFGMLVVFAVLFIAQLSLSLPQLVK